MSHVFLLPVSQSVPIYPGIHEQLYPLTRSVHDPPFWHGFEPHSSISKLVRCMSYFWFIWDKCQRASATINCLSLSVPSVDSLPGHKFDHGNFRSCTNMHICPKGMNIMSYFLIAVVFLFPVPTSTVFWLVVEPLYFIQVCTCTQPKHIKSTTSLWTFSNFFFVGLFNLYSSAYVSHESEFVRFEIYVTLTLHDISTLMFIWHFID